MTWTGFVSNPGWQYAGHTAHTTGVILFTFPFQLLQSQVNNHIGEEDWSVFT
jgi:hypothetical protein